MKKRIHGWMTMGLILAGGACVGAYCFAQSGGDDSQRPSLRSRFSFSRWRSAKPQPAPARIQSSKVVELVAFETDSDAQGLSHHSSTTRFGGPRLQSEPEAIDTQGNYDLAPLAPATNRTTPQGSVPPQLPRNQTPSRLNHTSPTMNPTAYHQQQQQQQPWLSPNRIHTLQQQAAQGGPGFSNSLQRQTRPAQNQVPEQRYQQAPQPPQPRQGYGSENNGVYQQPQNPPAYTAPARPFSNVQDQARNFGPGRQVQGRAAPPNNGWNQNQQVIRPAGSVDRPMLGPNIPYSPQLVDAINAALLRQNRPPLSQPAENQDQQIRRFPQGQGTTVELLSAIGDVEIVAIDALGIVIVRGAPQDVEAVLKIIDEIQKISVEVAPVVKTFQLHRASATQVRQTIDELYGTSQSSGTSTTTNTTQQQTVQNPVLRQFQLAVNNRANLLVVLASPQMMEELASLIQSLDVDRAPIVNDVKVFKLKNAQASEVQDILNQAITGAAASLTGGFQAQPQAGTPAGAGSEATLAQRFSVLRFIPLSGDERSAVDSGILDEVRIIAQIRTNSVVVMAPTSSMKLMEALIKELDSPPSLVADMRVFMLNNSDATNMRQTLTELFDVEVTTTTLGGGGGLNNQNQQFQRPVAVGDGDSPPISIRVGIDTRTNSLIVAGSESALVAVESVIRMIDSNDIRARQNTPVRLKNASSDAVAAAIGDFFNQKRQIEAQARTAQQQDLIGAYQRLEQEVIVVSEPITNTILVSSSPRFYDEVMMLVDELDRMQQQVMIQVMIGRLDLDNDFELGLEWGLQDSLLFDRGGTVSAAGPGQPDLIVPGFNFNNTQGLPNSTAFQAAQVAGQALSNFALGRAGAGGFGGLILSASSESVSALLRALEAQGCLKIISRPQVMTLDGRQARVQVGEQIPYLGPPIDAQATTGTIGTGQAQTQTSFLDIGIIMDVTPVINPDGRVVLSITPSVSELIEFVNIGSIITGNGVTQTIQAPRTSETLTDTVVSVRDGQSVILGGLIQETDSQVVRKIPWLGDLPYCGALFRYTQERRVRTELIIVLTPHIINDDPDADRVKAMEVNRVNWILNDVEEIHGDIGVYPMGPIEQIHDYNMPSEQTGPAVDQTPLPPIPEAATN